MRGALTILGVAAFGALPLAAPATMQRPATAASAQLNPRAVVAEVRRILAERYVLPERRPALDAILAKGLASGRYDVPDASALAERINADLADVGKDHHTNFSFDPKQAAILAAVTNKAAPDNSGYERLARNANHGITELRVMPGNIRYMAYDGFHWIGPESAAALDNAMRFLSGGDAAIIDLRRNGGGSPAAVNYLISHFVPAGKPLVTFYMNGTPSPDKILARAELPAGRMVGKPLYVLTSNASASAAEEFSGHVGGYRLGELVGETTAGAGFRNELVPIDGRFVLSVSVGRAVLASTGKDWEAVGIAPTIRTEVPKALDVAHGHALGKLAAAAPAADRVRLAALGEAVLARAESRTPTLPLTSYAGKFGERVVSLEDGRLYYQRGNLPRTPLIALGGNRFAFDNNPALRLDFEASGSSARAFSIASAGEPSQGRYERTQ